MPDKLITSNPDLWHELDLTKNQDVDLEGLALNASKKVWWKCTKDKRHVWAQTVRARAIQGYGCPYCSGLKTLKEESFGALYPNFLKEWDYEKNQGVDPFKYSKNSSKVVWWRCINNHEWSSNIHHRTRNGSSCRECRKLKYTIPNKCPSLLSEWHPLKNSNIDPSSISCHSDKAVWWQCKENHEHEWQTAVRSRYRGRTGCPHCKSEKIPLNGVQNKYPSLLEFSPRLADEWHPTKNEGLTANEYTAGSNKKVWWLCSKNSEHEWEASIGNRALKLRGCPYCARSKVSKDNSLVDRHPSVANQWHPSKNGTLKTSDVSYGSAKRVWWRCDVNPDHEWEATVVSRTRNNKSGCPICSGVLVGRDNTLSSVYPDIAKEWHPTKNEPLTPDSVTKASGKKVWWRCLKSPDHEWYAQIKNRTVLGSGCPICSRDWGRYQVQNSLIESANLNTDYFKTFVLNLNNLKKLSAKNLGERRLQQPFYRMVYSSTITCMETYLSDAFYHLVMPNDELVHKLLCSDPEFSDRKFSVKELLAWSRNGVKEVEKHLFSIAWHNLAKVHQMYKSVLDIKFPEEMGSIYRAVSIRHDLVHRNGKTKSGTFHKITEQELQELFVDIHRFVAHLDTQAGALKKGGSSSC